MSLRKRKRPSACFWGCIESAGSIKALFLPIDFSANCWAAVAGKSSELFEFYEPKLADWRSEVTPYLRSGWNATGQPQPPLKRARPPVSLIPYPITHVPFLKRHHMALAPNIGGDLRLNYKICLSRAFHSRAALLGWSHTVVSMLVNFCIAGVLLSNAGAKRSNVLGMKYSIVLPMDGTGLLLI